MNTDLPDFGNALNADIVRQMVSVLEAMADGVWVCDATPRLLWVNRACEKLNDIRREDVCGKTVRDLLSQQNFDKDVTTRVLEEGRPVAINQKVRSGRTLLVSGVPVFGDDGSIIYVVGSERDLTELNALREELSDQEKLASKLRNELRALKFKNAKLDEVVADSEAMGRALDTALRVAGFDTTVLITGPSGAGKSMIARIIHEGSNRLEGPFLSVNCGAIPRSLIEAELFGYTAGAFTGANKGGKVGLLEAAAGGTLFLDEIDAFPMDVQVKLLTFLDTKGLIRVGDTRIRKVDVRLIAATNKKLEKMVNDGTFREDLWFRLNVVPVRIPALSERQADIPPLIRMHLARLCKRHGVERRITSNAVDLLCRHKFSGNVRELENILERSFVLCQGTVITHKDLPAEVRDNALSRMTKTAETNLKRAVDEVERQALERALETGQRQVDLARILGVSQPTVARLMKKHRVKRQRNSKVN